MLRGTIVKHPAVKSALPVGSRRRALAAKAFNRVWPAPPPTAASRQRAQVASQPKPQSADQQLRAEEKKLRAKWQSSRPEILGHYLVTGVQDPRINVQSIMARHMFVRALFGSEFDSVMSEELVWAVELNNAIRLKAAELGVSLKVTSDPAKQADIDKACEVIADRVGTYGERWRNILADREADRLSVLEYACGSANDYRSFADYGIARFLDYTGVDITEANIQNARKMFPDVNFRVGSVLSLPEADRSVDFVIGFDIMEHLSLAGMQRAMDSAIRVCRRGIYFAYFIMEEIPDHVEIPVSNYHRNRISAPLIRQQMADAFDTVELINIPKMLREDYDYPYNISRRAYSLIAEGPRAA